MAFKVGDVAKITLFIALSERDAQTVGSQGYLDPKRFGGYIPFKYNEGAALRAALQMPGETSAMDAALYPSRWHVLMVEFSASYIGLFMLAKTLTHCTVRGQPGLQCTEVLDLERCTRIVREIPATGLLAWSDTFLPRRQFNGMRGRCNECENTEMPVFLGRPSYYNGKQFCVACWHAFYLARAQQAEAKEAEEADKAAEADKDCLAPPAWLTPVLADEDDEAAPDPGRADPAPADPALAQPCRFRIRYKRTQGAGNVAKEEDEEMDAL